MTNKYNIMILLLKKFNNPVRNCLCRLVTALCLVVLSACVSVPENVTPVTGFELSRYLGKWYEIARLDHSFERGLSNVTAQYSLRDDGGVKVINRGYSIDKGTWKEAEGKAYFVREPNEAYLKVSFFGPFYGAYIVFALDKQGYQYSLVSGPDKDFLWILSRTPMLDSNVYEQLVAKANELGYPTDDLIVVAHDKDLP